jgi:hypothetical protein
VPVKLYFGDSLVQIGALLSGGHEPVFLSTLRRFKLNVLQPTFARLNLG